jgi:uncharacterized protein Yka (UPF0111/DUF47 family)
MTSKTRMISELGESELLLPRLVNDALAANDRVKYYFTLLQMAKGHADNPEMDHSNLKKERQASGVEYNKFDGAVESSHKEKDGNYYIPEARRIYDLIVQDITDMMSPLEAFEKGQRGRTRAKAFQKRLQSITEKVPELDKNMMPGSLLQSMTSGQRKKGDSLHLLVMDLHKELNKLQSSISKETIDGARVYGIDEDDRPLIKAFMNGLNRTAKLKFEHPGLGTTVTRNKERLVIQNDIGTTDAHVLVVHVLGMTVTVTYTDIHIQRLMFFQSLFEKKEVHWEDTRSKKTKGLEEADVYHLSVGQYTAQDIKGLEEFLTFLGSRIVFLIDWNRARKRLRYFVKKRDCIEILKWAADNNHGHMGFLKLGGEQLIYEAIELTAKAPLRYGEQLHEVLGKKRAIEFLKFTIRTTAEGLLNGRSEFLIRDEIRAELMNYFHSAHQGMLEVAADHATLIVELATCTRDGVLKAQAGGSSDFLERNAKRAKKWENRADNLVQKARTMVKRSSGAEIFEELLRISDDVADNLEEVIFTLTLLPGNGATAQLYQPLQTLADLVVQGSQEYLKSVENARHVHRGSSRGDMQDFLEAIDKIITIEQMTDVSNRRVKAGIMKHATDFKQLHIFSEVAKNLEQAADALMRSALILRDYVLGEVMIR